MSLINSSERQVAVDDTGSLPAVVGEIGFARDEPYDVVDGLTAGEKVSFDRSVLVQGFIGAGAEITVNGNIGFRGDGVGASVTIRATKNILIDGSIGASCNFNAGENILVRKSVGAGSKMQAGGIVRAGRLGASVTVNQHVRQSPESSDSNPLRLG